MIFRIPSHRFLLKTEKKVDQITKDLRVTTPRDLKEKSILERNRLPEEHMTWLHLSWRYDVAAPATVFAYFYEGNDLNDNLKRVRLHYPDGIPDGFFEGTAAVDRFIEAEAAYMHHGKKTLFYNMFAAKFVQLWVRSVSARRKAMAGETDGTPAMASAPLSGHTDAVWQVRWVRQGERGERLISISTDGRVKVWSMKKGLEHVDLMRLTRVARRRGAASASAAKPAEPTISRRGAGTCFDFSRADPTTYVAGTEEGVLHKCSSAYSEQYLRTYHGHSGPVHRAVWSPFARDVFASASADWTTKLWFDAEENAALTLQSGRGVDVTDVAWSPSDATVLATSSLDGGLDVWDLAISTLRPAVSAATAGGSLACVAFSETSPVIVAGGRGGFVGVYRLVGAQDGARDESGRLKAALGGGAA